VLLLAADAVRRGGKNLLFAGLTVRDARTRMIRDMDVHGLLADEQFLPDADRALEHAEDRLLADVACTLPDCPPLTLAEMLGPSFSADEIELLSSLTVERTVAKGQAVFRHGEPGDAMYLLLRGQIGIWLPATADEGSASRGRRLVSFAPGVVFGEMGLLAGLARSADAIAESDALLVELGRTQYQELMNNHPTLLGKLLLNISLLLASRVRSLTDELQASQSVN
jgi:sulfate permease, SulP family